MDDDAPDSSSELTPPPIKPARHVSARELARHTAQLLREVTDEDRSFAVRHFGRVVGFLVPLDGRVPITRKGELFYEVEPEEPPLELTDEELGVMLALEENGPMVNPTTWLVPPAEMFVLLGRMTIKDLVEQAGPYWRITPYGRKQLAG